MRAFFLFFTLLFTLIGSAQENCSNGIDDDGDGKIDLNDPDCICNTSSITSIIPNPSFETYTSCPTQFSQLNLATPWIQATEATTDYYNTCGFIMPAISAAGLQNFPDGNGIVGALYLSDWNEYLGATLLSPMIAGTNYQLTFKIAGIMCFDDGSPAGINVNTLEPVNLTLYGCTNGANLPINTTYNPTSLDPSWIEIGHATYNPVSNWGEITILFTPSINVNAIMLGPPPVLPLSYPSNTGVSYPYFLYDNLLLNTASSFGVNITKSGNFCDNNLVLNANITANVGTGTTYQWYHNGIAIAGATNSTYSIPSFPTSLGNYSVKITNGSTCYISSNFMVNNIISSPSFTTVPPNCIVTSGSITITTPASEYSFDNGATWQLSPTKNMLAVGTYYIKIKTPNGCVSSASGVSITEPQLLGNSNITVTQPTTCDGTGSITINSSIAAQYSFDDGVTWTTNATATNLIPGNYFIRVKDAAGCQSSSQFVIINTIYLGNPTFTVTQPVCGTGGTINITTTAAQYSFDDGVTWTTNPIANDLAPGTYLIKIRNAAGCESYTQYAFLNTFYLNVIPTFTIIQPICGTGGTITITTPAAQYSLDGGTTWTTNPIASNLAPGTYYIMIQNSLGCISNYQYANLDYFYLPNPTYTIVQPVCGIGGTITITTPSDQYSFDGGNTWTTNPIASNLAPGTYYIMIQNSLGCRSNYQYANLDYFYLPNPTFVAVNPSCGNIGSITITTPAAQYSFDGGNTWTTNPVANNLQAGYYYIKIKNALGCESNYVYAYLDSTYLATPNYTVVQPGCGTNGSITITTTAAQYSFDGGNTWTANPVASNLAPGSYYNVIIKNSSGCVSSYQSVYMESYYLPNPTFTIVQPICGTGGIITITTPSAQYSFDGGTTWVTNPVASNLASGYYYILIKNSLGCVSNYQYAYLDPFYLPNPTFTVTQPSCGTGGTITITTPSAQYSFDGGTTWVTNPVASNLASGYYSILIKNSLGCVSYNQYASLDQFYLPDPTFTVTQPSCGNGGSITIATPSDQYSFDNGSTWTTNPIASNLVSGYYYILIKNALGCVSYAQYVYIYSTSPTPSAPSVTFVQPTSCGATNGSITINSFGVLFSFDNGVTWGTSSSLNSLGDGTYLIRIKDSNNGCPSLATTVTLNGSNNVIVAPTFTTVQPNCSLVTGTITINTVAAQYSFDNGVTWSTSNSQSSLVAGTYLIKIKNNLGCISLANSAIINLISIPNVPTYTVIQPNCSFSTGAITINSIATEYSFNNGITWSTTNVQSGLIQGTYLLKVKNSVGCISLASSAVINPSPETPLDPILSVIQPSSCSNPFGSINVTSSALLYSFDNGVTYSGNPNSGLLAIGTYLVKVKNSSNCESQPVTVTINAPTDYPLAPTVSIIQPNCSNPKGTITVNSIATEFSFDNGITWGTTATLGNLNPGTYLIKIKNTVGCISNATTAIIIPFTNFPPTPSVTSPQTFCIQQNATINEIIIVGQNIKWYDALMGGNLLPNTTLLQNSTTYYTSQTIGGCESIRVPILINIQNTQPPTGSSSQTFCTSLNPTLNNVVVSGTNLIWYDSFTSGTILAVSTLLTNGVTYYVSQTINGCESIIRLAVTISLTTSLPANNYAASLCDNLNDGSETVDLNSYNSYHISNASAYSFAYYTTLIGAENELVSDQINNSSNYPLNLGVNKVFVRIVSNTSCYKVVELKLTLIASPTVNMQNTYSFCENSSITITAGSSSGFTYLWSTLATTPSITVNQPGNYWVTVSQNHNPLLCSTRKDFTVVASNSATITNIITSDWTDNQNTITILISESSIGNYEYSIDGIHYQDSNIFYGLNSGSYTVYVHDKNECGTMEEDVFLLMYPTFFTPNGDSYNDFWSIKFSYFEPGLKVKIMDRYGKFIKELFHNTSWDGTYNGQELPSTDYWFVVTRANGKEHRGHFTLKR
ncbi:T9SS type B sorting domain-containing protein [Flavobacterium sp.]|uniref:T9SS type B sorting domain-containing protein n=1 Tax=Flavobacterium sp. TaxID=239 RepID=UPI002B4B41EC|nr:T9SS type B sorting domain-containing protein [Flavobacterium sp.]HLF52002.1 T9SS type B sorting domain-containing protein [Flavobacterium sp.]